MKPEEWAWTDEKVDFFPIAWQRIFTWFGGSFTFDSSLREGYFHSLFLRPFPVDGNRARSPDVATHCQAPAGPPWLMMTPRRKKVWLLHNPRGSYRNKKGTLCSLCQAMESEWEGELVCCGALKFNLAMLLEDPKPLTFRCTELGLERGRNG